MGKSDAENLNDIGLFSHLDPITKVYRQTDGQTSYVCAMHSIAR